MNKNRNFLKQIKEIVFRLTNNKKLNLKEINFSEDFDSLQMLDFVEELERCFEIKISPQDLNHKNFSNLKNLEKIIKEDQKYKRKLMIIIILQ